MSNVETVVKMRLAAQLTQGDPGMGRGRPVGHKGSCEQTAGARAAMAGIQIKTQYQLDTLKKQKPELLQQIADGTLSLYAALQIYKKEKNEATLQIVALG